MLRQIRRGGRPAAPGGLEQMTWKPQLNVVCGRCGKPRGLAHTCFSNSTRKATVKPKVTFGKCPTCKKTVANPLTHVCVVKGGFKRAKAKGARQQAAARKKRQAEQHPYESCRDGKCKRPMCVAYRTGWHEGEASGFDSGFQAGLAACPGPHSG
jgi:hypothetical protein